MKNIIAIGAEAILYYEDNRLIKKRISKGYRIKEIDEKIRKLRTRSEAKILRKLEFVPEVFNYDDKNMEISMEFINGDLVRDVLDNLSNKKRRAPTLSIGLAIFSCDTQKGTCVRLCNP